MAVFIGCINVVAPVAVIEEKYPGGLDAYRKDCPNRSFCCDGHLTRVGFMGPPEVEEFIDNLTRMGLQPMAGENWKDVAVVDSIFKAPTLPCDWVHVGVATNGMIFACLKEHEKEPGMICVSEASDAKKTVN